MRNRIEKTEAVVLRVSPFSRTSHVVTWLAPEFGKLATVVKGACRPKSPFLGQYDLYYTCELLFYARERNGLHIARECTPANIRSTLRTDWRASSCASYLCDLVSRVSIRGHQHEIYDLTVAALDSLCTDGASSQFVFWSELKLLGCLGLSPQLTKCPACDRNLDGIASTDFSHDRGGILCRDCARHQGSTVTRIQPDVLAMLRNWQRATSPRAATTTRCTPKQLAAFREILGMFLPYHLDMPTMPRSRSLALDIVSYARGSMNRSGRSTGTINH